MLSIDPNGGVEQGETAQGFQSRLSRSAFFALNSA
jgi:hypothetical protein